MKDVMVLYEMGIPAISFNGEGMGYRDGIFEDLFNNLKERFEHIVVLYDNDESGLKHGHRLSGEYRLKLMFLYAAKDISDLVKLRKSHFSFRYLKKRLSKVLKTTNSNYEVPY
jgi:hypothetical protein